MPTTTTTRLDASGHTRVTAAAVPQSAEACEQVTRIHGQLRALAGQATDLNALVDALFDLQLGRADVVACIALTRRADGTSTPGAAKSRLAQPQLEKLLKACESSREAGQSTPTYTIHQGYGAICIPVTSRQLTALITLIRHPDDSACRAIETAVAQLVAGQLERFSERQQLAETASQLANSAAILELVQRIEAEDHSRSACFVVANALKLHLRCQRIVVGLKTRSGLCRVVAVSGLAQVDEHSDETRRIKAVLDECLLRNELGAWPPLPGQATVAVEHSQPPGSGRHQLIAHERLARGNTSVISTPLRTADEAPMGALLIIGPSAASHRVPVARFADSLGEPLGSAIAIVQRAAGSRLRRALRTVMDRRFARRRWIAAACTAALVAIMMIPIPYKVACQFVTEPLERRFCVAPHDGLLERTLVEPGDVIDHGHLLARMDGREVQWELAGVVAERGRAAKRRDAHMSKHETSATLLAELEMKRLESQLNLLRFREQNMEVVSPISGVVLSGSLDRRENYPVTKGQVLYEIAPLDQLRVEVAIPADELTRVQAGMRTELKFAGFGHQTREGRLRTIRPRSEVRDGENVFIGEVIVDNTNRQLRPGMKGQGKIVSRQQTIGWILFHRFWEKACVLWPW